MNKDVLHNHSNNDNNRNNDANIVQIMNVKQLEVQKLTRPGLNEVSEGDVWKTNLPFSRLIKFYT